MKTLLLGLGSLFVLNSFAHAQSLNLRANPQMVRDKARAIEQSYSQNRRDSESLQQSEQYQPLIVPGNQAAPVVETRSATTTETIQQDLSYDWNTPAHTMTYQNNLKMRENRKVGAGLAMGGVSGVVGAALEFNFEDADGAVAGFGTGPGYNTFNLGWKHNFEGTYLSPYTTMGYSHWYNASGDKSAVNDSAILNRVLTDSEKASGRFGADFVTASLGLQYNQLSGDFSGVSIFGELTAMYEIQRSQLLPTGAVGALYYF